MPDAQPIDSRPDGPTPGQSLGMISDATLGAVERLDEIPGVGQHSAQVILAEIGLDTSRFATAAHLMSWAKLCPRTIQSGPLTRGGKTSKGNPYRKGALGEAAAAATKTNTFLDERYRRIVKRHGKLKALVAVARSILVIIWNLLNDPSARFCDLGADYHAPRINAERKTRNYVAQLMAMGYRVTLESGGFEFGAGADLVAAHRVDGLGQFRGQVEAVEACHGRTVAAFGGIQHLPQGRRR